MKLPFRQRDRGGPRAGERGSATLVVFILLLLLVALLGGNSRTLIQLKRELRLIEQQQLQRYESNPHVGAALAEPVPRVRP